MSLKRWINEEKRVRAGMLELANDIQSKSFHLGYITALDEVLEKLQRDAGLTDAVQELLKRKG